MGRIPDQGKGAQTKGLGLYDRLRPRDVGADQGAGDPTKGRGRRPKGRERRPRDWGAD